MTKEYRFEVGGISFPAFLHWLVRMLILGFFAAQLDALAIAFLIGMLMFFILQLKIVEIERR